MGSRINPSVAKLWLLENRNSLTRFVHYHAWWLVVVFASILLLVHSIKNQIFVVDNVSIVLLIVILVSPASLALRKIKIPGLEAEIGSDEVGEVAAEADRSVTEEPLRQVESRSKLRVVDYVKELAENDPVLALAKIRIEIETYIRKLFLRLNNPNLLTTPNLRTKSARQLVKALTERSILGPRMSATIDDVMSICNRAIHGEDIQEADAERIVKAGTTLISELAQMLATVEPAGSVAKRVLSTGELDALLHSRFRLTTVVPLVNDPEERIYELDKTGLDDFFDSYGDFAEFVIKVEIIDSELIS